MSSVSTESEFRFLLLQPISSSLKRPIIAPVSLVSHHNVSIDFWASSFSGYPYFRCFWKVINTSQIMQNKPCSIFSTCKEGLHFRFSIQ